MHTTRETLKLRGWTDELIDQHLGAGNIDPDLLEEVAQYSIPNLIELEQQIIEPRDPQKKHHQLTRERLARLAGNSLERLPLPPRRNEIAPGTTEEVRETLLALEEKLDRIHQRSQELEAGDELPGLLSDTIDKISGTQRHLEKKREQLRNPPEDLKALQEARLTGQTSNNGWSVWITGERGPVVMVQGHDGSNFQISTLCLREAARWWSNPTSTQLPPIPAHLASLETDGKAILWTSTGDQGRELARQAIQMPPMKMHEDESAQYIDATVTHSQIWEDPEQQINIPAWSPPARGHKNKAGYHLNISTNSDMSEREISNRLERLRLRQAAIEDLHHGRLQVKDSSLELPDRNLLKLAHATLSGRDQRGLILLIHDIIGLADQVLDLMTLSPSKHTERVIDLSRDPRYHTIQLSTERVIDLSSDLRFYTVQLSETIERLRPNQRKPHHFRAPTRKSMEHKLLEAQHLITHKNQVSLQRWTEHCNTVVENLNMLATAHRSAPIIHQLGTTEHPHVLSPDAALLQDHITAGGTPLIKLWNLLQSSSDLISGQRLMQGASLLQEHGRAQLRHGPQGIEILPAPSFMPDWRARFNSNIISPMIFVIFHNMTHLISRNGLNNQPTHIDWLRPPRTSSTAARAMKLLINAPMTLHAIAQELNISLKEADRALESLTWRGLTVRTGPALPGASLTDEGLSMAQNMKVKLPHTPTGDLNRRQAEIMKLSASLLSGQNTPVTLDSKLGVTLDCQLPGIDHQSSCEIITSAVKRTQGENSHPMNISLAMAFCLAQAARIDALEEWMERIDNQDLLKELDNQYRQAIPMLIQVATSNHWSLDHQRMIEAWAKSKS